MITCEYCENFKTLVKSKQGELICNDLLINAKSEICEKYKKQKFFYCNRNFQRLNIMVCKGRRERIQGQLKESYSNCENCSQSIAIDDIIKKSQILRMPKRPIKRLAKQSPKLLRTPKKPLKITLRIY